MKKSIKHVIIIFPENRRFDSMYGSFLGANGLNALETKVAQVSFDSGAAFVNGYQPNTNGLRPPAGQSSAPNVPDNRLPAATPNQPYDVPTVTGNQVLTDDETGDLIHRFYLEQYQINNPAAFMEPVTDPKNANDQVPMSKFAAFSTNPGLVMDHFDASGCCLSIALISTGRQASLPRLDSNSGGAKFRDTARPTQRRFALIPNSGGAKYHPLSPRRRRSFALIPNSGGAK